MRAMNFNFDRFYIFKIEGYFLNQDFTGRYRNMSKEYHTRSTQEFTCRYSDKLLIFL